MSESTRRMQLHVSGSGQLELSGAIDETAGLLDLLQHATPDGELGLDLGGVTFINSLGVRDWIRMQSTATQRQIQLELRRVAEVLVHQLNMIIATRGTARIASFFAPYACDACGREESLLIDAFACASQLTQLQPPQMTCPECSAPMAFNDFPERYFSFLATG
jgi:anti-anti-sigma regulatory factor